MSDDKWTIRRVSEEARAMIEEAHELTGISYGRLVSEAIQVWFELAAQGGTPTPRFFTRSATRHEISSL